MPSKKCGWCGRRDRELRPVCMVGEDEPRLLCSGCHDAADACGYIDHERDAEVFGYAN